MKIKKEIFAVGGCVRDEILGLVPKDFDFVVTGHTEQDMIDQGFEKVVTTGGFPVFLHPETKEEYALARTERSTGPGYHDFEMVYGPDITIEQDLARRDFSMNSIAKNIETNEIVDPFGGVEDIRKRIIRSINKKAFEEDPVRILRMARFAARFPAFKIEEETLDLAKNTPVLDNITAERVNLELIKALESVKPSIFFEVLNEIGVAKHWFKEVFDLIDVPQPLKWHLESCAFGHTMMVLDSAAKHNTSLEVRFGCLVHDFGKATTKETWPSHPAHEIRGVPLVHDFCDRLKIANDLRKAGAKSAQYHGHVHKAFELKPKTYIKVYEDIKSDPNSFAEIIGNVAFHDNEGKLPYENYGGRYQKFVDNIEKLSFVKLSNSYSQEEIDEMSIDKRKQVIHNMRLDALK